MRISYNSINDSNISETREVSKICSYPVLRDVIYILYNLKGYRSVNKVRIKVTSRIREVERS